MEAESNKQQPARTERLAMMQYAPTPTRLQAASGAAQPGAPGGPADIYIFNIYIYYIYIYNYNSNIQLHQNLMEPTIPIVKYWDMLEYHGTR